MSPRHRPPRLATIFYDPPLYFITICVRRRFSILATDLVHSAFQDFAMRGFQKKQIAIGRYVIMPDHLHLFVLGPHEFQLKQWGEDVEAGFGQSDAQTPRASQKRHYIKRFFGNLGAWFL
jgi:transposase IS200 family protein